MGNVKEIKEVLLCSGLENWLGGIDVWLDSWVELCGGVGLGYIITKFVDLEARFPVVVDEWNVKSVKRGVKKE